MTFPFEGIKQQQITAFAIIEFRMIYIYIPKVGNHNITLALSGFCRTIITRGMQIDILQKALYKHILV